jgi:hypothetical protein
LCPHYPKCWLLSGALQQISPPSIDIRELGYVGNLREQWRPERDLGPKCLAVADQIG